MKNTRNICLGLILPFLKGALRLCRRDFSSSLSPSSVEEGCRRRCGGVFFGGVFFFSLSLSLLSLFFFFPSSVSAAILGKPPNNLGLTGYWAFNEGAGTTYGDSSGNSNSGTVTGAPSWINGKRAKALSFDGNDDHIIVTDSTSLRSGNDWTMAAWIKIKNPDPGSGADRIIIGKQGWHGGLLRLSDAILFSITNTVGTSHSITYNVNPAEWHYYTGTYTSSGGAMELFVDGVSAGTTTFNTATTMNYQAQTDLYIGGSGTDQYHTFAEVDEVRIYNRKLTSAQITALYGSGAVARKAPNQKNLLGYWSFDENTGTVLGNASGSGSFNGTITGATWATGKKGSALSFDRSGDYVNMGGIVLTGTNQPFTMSAWVNPANLTDSWKTIMAGTCTGFDVAISGAALQIGRNCGAPGVFYNVYTFPEANRWYHVVAVYDGTNINAYVDGVFYTGGAVAYTNLSTFCIGSYDCVNELFNGKIDEVYLWNRALSAAEITALYTSNSQKINSSQNTRLTSGLVGLWSFNGGDISNGVALDRSGQGNNGNLFSVASSTFYAAGKVGQGFNFDGSDDDIKVPSSSSLDLVGSFSISAWLKYTNTSSYGFIVSKSEGGNNGYELFRDTGAGTIRFSACNAVGTCAYPYFDITTSAEYNDGTWHHVVAVYDKGTQAYIYIDGAVVKASTSNPSASVLVSTSSLCIGGRGTSCSSLPFNGNIDEVRIYNRGLTAAEIKQLYNLGR